jgi:hypothetical protein
MAIFRHFALKLQPILGFDQVLLHALQPLPRTTAFFGEFLAKPVFAGALPAPSCLLTCGCFRCHASH